MESGNRKLASDSGINYRRIIPPLNDTESDSSLEYWEERGGAAMNDSSVFLGPVRIKKERLETVGENDCIQRMVYKIKPTDTSPVSKNNAADDGAGPSGVPAVREQFLSRRPGFMNVEDVGEDPRRQSSANPVDPRSPSNRPNLPDRSGGTPPVSSQLSSQGSEPAAKRPRLSDESMVGNVPGLNSNILSMIECPVCLEYMGPPIQQCKRGHLVCSSCRAQLVNCPTCRSRFTDLRNLVLERIVEMIKYPCRHDSCNQMHLLKDKAQHELNCEHRRYTCMAQGCDWRGVHAELVKHVKSQHAGLIHSGNELLVSFPIQMMANSSRNYVLYAFDEMFRVNFQRGPGASLVHGLVIYLGPIDNARNYNFSFKMEKEKDGVERGLTFSRTVLSDEHKPSVYYQKSEAFSATVDMLRLIATSKAKVHVEVRIERRVHKKESQTDQAPNDSNDEDNA